jgi:thymidylate kinase
VTPDPTRALLNEVAALVGYRAILWRGADPGSDVDLLVVDAALPELSQLLTGAGLRPEAGDPGHVVWTPSSSGDRLPLDILPFSAWPSYYPSLPGMMSRLQESEPGPPVASAADRALIFAAEVVAGRPIEKVVHRVRPLLATPGFTDDLRQVAAAEDLEALADLIERPDALMGVARRGRLPYPRAAALAGRSSAARAALEARGARRLGAMAIRAPLRRGRRRARPGPLLVTVSGMDGAGKSTAAGIIETRLRAAGLPAEIVWGRIGGESVLLNRLATPVKRVVRRSGTVADPVAAGGPGIQKVQDPREGQGRRRLVSWVWIVIVATANAGSYRRAASLRRRGTHVICDRWATDAFVDLELRYGRHRLAEGMLRRLSPERDLGVLLEIDARTAARRKPGDQAEHVLAAMEPLYAQRAREEGLVRIDSRRAPADIERTISAVVDALLSTR